MENLKQFQKISFEQWQSDYPEYANKDEIKEIYDSIALPQRATVASAGYDIYSPFDIVLKPKDTILIPTGLRVRMNDDDFLMIVPRSGLGFKFRLQMNNTVGIVDADYYGAKNEGHLLCRITNDSNEGKILEIKKGQGFVQGIFFKYGITIDDAASGIRTGGFGSTTK